MVFLNGDGIPYMGQRGEPVRDESMLIMFNAYHEPLPFTLPGPEFGESWEVFVDTAMWDVPEPRPIAAAKTTVEVAGRSAQLLIRVPS
jgi:isoamylase